MTAFFMSVLERSAAASFVILAVIAARALTRRSPKWTRGILWTLVALRLVLPFTFHSAVSLVPELPVFTEEEQISEATEPLPQEPTSVITSPPSVQPPVEDGVKPDPIISDVREPASQDTDVQYPVSQSTEAQSDVSQDTPTSQTSESEGTQSSAVGIAAIVWLAVSAAMILYFAVCYVRLWTRVRSAVYTEPGVWQCDRINSAFVFGVVRPRIYLPCGIDPTASEYIIAHERAHIRRKDHIAKLIAFFLLAVHWFNPMVWLSYVLFCRDMELACDEYAVRTIEPERIQEYARTLLVVGTERQSSVAYPISFGSNSIKARIKNILNYKKPSFFAISAALLVCVVTAVCFATAPIARDADKDAPSESEEETDGASLEHIGEALFTHGDSSVRSIEISWEQDVGRTVHLSADGERADEFVRFAEALRYCAPSDANASLVGLTVTLIYDDDHTQTHTLGTVTVDGAVYGVSIQEKTEFFTLLRKELAGYFGADGSDPGQSAYTFILHDLESGDTLGWEAETLTILREETSVGMIDLTKYAVYTLECADERYLLISRGSLFDLHRDAFGRDDDVIIPPTESETEPETEPEYETEPEPEEWVWHPAGATRYNIQPRSDIPQSGTPVELTPGSINLNRWNRPQHPFEFVSVPIYEGEEQDSTRRVAICVADTYRDLLSLEDYIVGGTENTALTEYYSESFFEDRSIILMYNTSGSGSISVDAEKLILNGSELCICAKTYVMRAHLSVGYTAMIGYHYSVLEIDKSVLDGVDTLSCYIRASNPPFPFEIRDGDGSGFASGTPVGFTLGYNAKRELYSEKYFMMTNSVVNAPEGAYGIFIEPYIVFSAEDFAETVSTRQHEEHRPIYEQLTAKYNDAYFADRAVIVVSWMERRMRELEFTGVCRSGDELCLQISIGEYKDDIHFEDLNQCLAIIEVDRSAFDGVSGFSFYAQMKSAENTVE